VFPEPAARPIVRRKSDAGPIEVQNQGHRLRQLRITAEQKGLIFHLIHSLRRRVYKIYSGFSSFRSGQPLFLWTDRATGPGYPGRRFPLQTKGLPR